MIKLLLVEDDTNLCYIIRGGLEDMIGGYEVMTASNGEEGLRIYGRSNIPISLFQTLRCLLWMVMNGTSYPGNGWIYSHCFYLG